jgi:hypothetical protein
MSHSFDAEDEGQLVHNGCRVAALSEILRKIIYLNESFVRYAIL